MKMNANRYLCICLSSAIDATVRLASWPTEGCIIKNAVDVFAPGGKAVNVARWLAKRGATVACGGLLGEDNAALFEKELAKYGIEDRFVRVPGSTRVNEMFVTPQGSFKINREASGGLPRAWEDLGGSAGFDVVVLSGSLPKAWPMDTYRTFVAAEFQKATAALKAFCEVPIISDGAAGCWFDGKFVAAPTVEVLDTTAAGDTLLAEWCFSGDARLAVAAGSAACMRPGGEPPEVDFVLALERKVG